MGGGLDTILGDGRKYWCFNFGGSLLGALAGCPTNKKCARAISRAVAGEKEKSVDKSTEVASEVHLNAFFLFLLCLTSFLVIFLLSL